MGFLRENILYAHLLRFYFIMCLSKYYSLEVYQIYPHTFGTEWFLLDTGKNSYKMFKCSTKTR